MHKPNDYTPAHTPDAGKVTPAQKNPTVGFETTDVDTRGVLVFLVSLGAFLLVFFLFCFGMGKVINTELVKHDGPVNKWNQIAAVPHKRGKSMESSSAMEQQQLQLMTQRFPTPRLQTDDGHQDLVDMHQREDLLLDHYTWVNRQQGVVRIPIDRAMELIVERGLPVAPGTPAQAPVDAMSIESQDVAGKITPPLTNGFARSTYEQELSTQDNFLAHRTPTETSSNQKPTPGTAGQPTVQSQAPTQAPMANKSSNATQAKAESKSQAGGVQ